MGAAKRAERHDPAPRVVFVPRSVSWTFTARDGWQVSEEPFTAAEMDRLCDLFDEQDIRDALALNGPASAQAAA